MEILRFDPILQEKIWGGSKLHSHLGKGTAAQTNLGESWEVSDNDSGQTKVAQGLFQGQTLGEVLQSHRREILGELDTPDLKRFPLLFKFIDAREDLSVQVHPGDNSPLGDAKTETWYVVDAPPQADIIVGISSHAAREQILADLQTPRAPQVLNRIPVQSGDVLLITAGTVHAITAGLLIYEVQQNSDTTFRLYDWGRTDSRGNPRELHLKEAAQVIDYTVHHRHKIPAATVAHPNCHVTYLTATRYFAMLKYEGLRADLTLNPFGRFRVITCLKGQFIFTGAGGDVEMRIGDSLLIPADCGKVTVRDSQGGGEFISSFVPNIERDIIKPLQEAGFSQETIQALGGRTELTW